MVWNYFTLYFHLSLLMCKQFACDSSSLYVSLSLLGGRYSIVYGVSRFSYALLVKGHWWELLLCSFQFLFFCNTVLNTLHILLIFSLYFRSTKWPANHFAHHICSCCLQYLFPMFPFCLLLYAAVLAAFMAGILNSLSISTYSAISVPRIFNFISCCIILLPVSNLHLRGVIDVVTALVANIFVSKLLR